MKRECGSCFACCVAFDVRDIPGEQNPKPSGVPCKFLDMRDIEGACGIYTHRPTECRDYKCSWLQGMFGSHERPDKLGAIFDYRQAPIPGWYIREVSDVLSNPTSRASRRLLQCKKDMFTSYGKIEVIGVTRLDGTQYAYLPNGAIEKNPEKLQAIKGKPPESFIQLRRK